MSNVQNIIDIMFLLEEIERDIKTKMYLLSEDQRVDFVSRYFSLKNRFGDLSKQAKELDPENAIGNLSVEARGLLQEIDVSAFDARELDFEKNKWKYFFYFLTMGFCVLFYMCMYTLSK